MSRTTTPAPARTDDAPATARAAAASARDEALERRLDEAAGVDLTFVRRRGAYLAAGITLSIVLQAFINMGVTVGLLPTKGLPLPFVSYGGSSLLMSLAAAGVALNVSQHSG